MSWAQGEFETIELGDARLNQRAVLLAERIALYTTPQAPRKLLS